MNHWMFNCKAVTRMVSESLDRKLSFYQRMGIRMHLLMCKLCSRYRRQLLLLRETIRRQTASSEDIESEIVLPPGARERIKRSIRNALDLK
ncbi:MAG: zf-HC2 domain-containing protein [Deltaproteobacteria bacterium]|nr:zf-HC2 domain-containing protein [Deltaproteobacteria bacterium]